MKYPVPVTQVHEIELSSRCNMACSYCPNPTMRRPKVDMTWDTYMRALLIVRKLCDRGTQGELALTGVGEALLNPIFPMAVLAARKVIGPGRPLTFSTNGILLTDELLHEIKPADPIIFVSLHRPEVAAQAYERAKAHGFMVHTNHAFVTSSLDWAGQVQWYVSAPRTLECQYLRQGWCVIRADGRIGTCCWEAETHDSYIGDVDYDLDALCVGPHASCGKCSLRVPREDMANVI